MPPSKGSTKTKPSGKKARGAATPPRRPGITLWLVWLALLALPATRITLDLPSSVSRWIGLAVVLVSLVSFLLMRADKRRAERGQRRVPESVLHQLELIGGWPGSFLAQRIFRHKNAKTRYQLTFWLIVLLYQAVALYFSRHWIGI